MYRSLSEDSPSSVLFQLIAVAAVTVASRYRP